MAEQGAGGEKADGRVFGYETPGSHAEAAGQVAERVRLGRAFAFCPLVWGHRHPFVCALKRHNGRREKYIPHKPH